MGGFTGRAAAAALLIGSATVAPAAAQAGGPGGAPDGRVVPRVVVDADTTLSYMLFLPPAHDTDREWPVLVLMDPRGRAQLPFELFRPVASELGYIMLSSYDTSSDEATSEDRTRRAAVAMLNDASDALAIDRTRIYLVGFSGTDKVGWEIAARLRLNVAGLIGSGGGLPLVGRAMFVDAYDLDMSYFGAAGTRDFNYTMVRDMDVILDGTGVRHRIRIFDGEHQWMPEEVATEAVRWTRVQAQIKGLEPLDRAWVDGIYRTELHVAAGLEEAGRPYDAFQRYRQAAEGFDGALDVSAARAAMDRLAATRTVRDTRRAIQRWADWEERTVVERLTPALHLLRAGDLPPSLDRVTTLLRLDRLRRQAQQADTLAGQAAARILNSARVNAELYFPRDLLERGRPAHALRALELAYRIEPDATGLCGWWHAAPADLRERSARREPGRSLATACAGPADPP